MPEDVTVDLSGLENLKRIIRSGNRFIREGYTQWAAIYRADQRLRYVKYSRGGGDWAPLSPATLARRKKGKRKNLKLTQAPKILVDKAIMLSALETRFSKKKGQFEKELPDHSGIEVGYGGPGRYPKGGPTVADVASFHQKGGPNLPQRKVIDKPSAKAESRMAEVMTVKLAQAAGESNA